MGGIFQQLWRWVLLILVLSSSLCNAASVHDCKKHASLYPQVDADLQAFRAAGGIHPSNLVATQQHCSTHSHYHVCVQIRKGDIYITRAPDLADNHGLYAGFLLELIETSLRHHPLPDVDFALHVSDRPKAKKQLYTPAGAADADAKLLPVTLGYSKTKDFAEVLVPFAAHFRCYQNPFDQVLSPPKSNGSYDEVAPWESRKPLALGRYTVFCTNEEFRPTLPSGQRYPCAREHLLTLATSHPDKLDVWAPIPGSNRYLSFAAHASYKYIISTDGWTASSKLAKYLVLGSPVLKQESPLFEYYYAAMQPGKHYVPFYVKGHPDDIVQDVIPQLVANDSWARSVGAAGRAFALEHLTRPARLCYWREVLERLSQLVRYEKDLCTPVTLSNPSVHRFSNGTLYLPRGTCLRAVDYLVGILRPHVLTSTCDIKGQLQEMGVTATSLASAEASMYW